MAPTLSSTSGQERANLLHRLLYAFPPGTFRAVLCLTSCNSSFQTRRCETCPTSSFLGRSAQFLLEQKGGGDGKDCSWGESGAFRGGKGFAWTHCRTARKARRCKDLKLMYLLEWFAQVFDKYRRSLADFENLRNRMNKQVSDAKIFGIQGFCKVCQSCVLENAIDSTAPPFSGSSWSCRCVEQGCDRGACWGPAGESIPQGHAPGPPTDWDAVA